MFNCFFIFNYPDSLSYISSKFTLSYLILSYLSHDLIIKTADLFGCVRVGVECTDLDPEAT